jgi:hypothetical protein
MGKITRLPPGKAMGADDLLIWARRRNGKLSGVPDGRQPANRLHKQRQGHAKWLRLARDIAHDQWLFRLVMAGRNLNAENKQLVVHLVETLIRHWEAHKTSGPLGE